MYHDARPHEHQNRFMYFIENGNVEVNIDELDVLLQGAPFSVHSSISICVMWPVVTHNLVNCNSIAEGPVLFIIRTSHSLILIPETHFSEMSVHVVSHPRRQQSLCWTLEHSIHWCVNVTSVM